MQKDTRPRNPEQNSQVQASNHTSSSVVHNESQNLTGNAAANQSLKQKENHIAYDVKMKPSSGNDLTEQFLTLANESPKGDDNSTIVYIPPGDYVVQAPIHCLNRLFIFGLEGADKPRIRFVVPDGTKKRKGGKGLTGMVFTLGARIKNIDFQGGPGIDTLLQFGTTQEHQANEDDVDSSIYNSNFTDFNTGIRYNGRNCKIKDSVFNSQRNGSKDVHLSYQNIAIDSDGGKGTLPHYSHRKNSFKNNQFSAGGKRTGIHLSGDTPIRGLSVTGNEKDKGGSLLKVEGDGGLRDSIISGNTISQIDSSQRATIDLRAAEAQGLVLHDNQFGGLNPDSNVFRTASGTLKGDGSFKKRNQSEDRLHGMSVTGNEFQFTETNDEASVSTDTLTKHKKRIQQSRTLKKDIAWAGNTVVDSLSEREEEQPFPDIREDNKAYKTVRRKEKDTTARFEDLAADSSVQVIFLEPGMHVVTKPIVFSHKVKLVGPKSVGGAKSGRAKVRFEFNKLIASKEEYVAEDFTGFTFEAGADIQDVTFKGGKVKGDAENTVNLLQFGKEKGDNNQVSASVVGCNLGEFKGKRAITNYGSQSHFENNSFSDSPGKGTTAIELRSNGKKKSKEQHDIFDNTFHLGEKHTSVRTSGKEATKNLRLQNNVSDIGGRLLHVEGGLKNSQITSNTVNGTQHQAQSAIVDLENGSLNNLDFHGNSLAGLDLDTFFATWSEDELENDKYQEDPYGEWDRPIQVFRISDNAKVQEGGVDIFGNNLSFARTEQNAIQVDGKKNQKRVSAQANIIRNGSQEHTGDGGVSENVGRTGNVGSGKKRYPKS